MSLSLHTLAGAQGSRHRRKRVGRGNASGHGTTATRGTKGQRARQGGRKGLIQLGVKHFVAHLPKTRGFTSLSFKPQTVTLKDLEKFKPGVAITSKLLASAGLIADARRPVKLIGSGSPPNQIVISVQAVTKGAQAAVLKAGGKVEVVPLESKNSSKQSKFRARPS